MYIMYNKVIIYPKTSKLNLDYICLDSYFMTQ